MSSESFGPCFTFIDQNTGAMHVLNLVSGPGIGKEPKDDVKLFQAVEAKMRERDLETRYGVHDILYVDPAILGYSTYEVEPEQWEPLLQEWREVLTEVGFQVGSYRCFEDEFVQAPEPREAGGSTAIPEPITSPILPEEPSTDDEQEEFVVYVEPSPRLSFADIVAHVQATGAEVKHESPHHRVLGVISRQDEMGRLRGYSGVSLVTRGWGFHRSQWVPSAAPPEPPVPSLERRGR